MSGRTYLGDGLFAEVDGYGIRLSTNRGGTEHWVYLEPAVYAALLRYVEALGGDR